MTPIEALNAAGEADMRQAFRVASFLDELSRPTEAMRWLENAAKRLRESREADDADA